MKFSCDSPTLWTLSIFSSLSERTKGNGKTDMLVEGLEPKKKKARERFCNFSGIFVQKKKLIIIFK